MRTYLRQASQFFCKFFRHDTRFQRTQTDPFDPFNSMYRADQIQESFCLLSIFIFPFQSVRTEMDSGKHHFLIPMFRKCTHLFHYVFFFPAAHASSRIRNDAIGTELVASILHFQICPCMLCCSGKMEALILEGMVNVNDLLHLFRNVFFKIFFQKADQILFFIIPDYNIYILIQLTHIRLRLHITAGRYDHCIRILFSGTMDHLSGLAVCHIRHRAGIDHIDICQIMKRYDLISVLFQQFLHRFCFISIYLTAQVV